MTTSSVLAELPAIGERLLAEADGTLDGLVDRLQAEERENDHPAWRPRRRSQSGTTPSPHTTD